MPDAHLCQVEDLMSQAEALTSLRRYIHERPELAYREHATASLVGELLGRWGYDVATGIGGTGVVATLTAGHGGRSIGIRADMDALPIQEATGLPYASTVSGVMHACGHDGHTTILLGAAQYLATHRRFDGTLRLYFQPAEEAGVNSGAERMIAEGLFERFHCDAVFGLHNHPGQPAGRFLFRSGPFMASGDKVTITVRGKGSHAARPHLSVDPVVVASSIVMALQTVVARNVDPGAAAVVTVGVLQAGTANNVIPASARLELSVRAFDPRVRELLRQRIEALANAQAHGYGATVEIDYVLGYPVVVNSDAETAFAIEVARELVGDADVDAAFEPVMASEDFAFMLQQRPGCFLRLGNGIGQGMGEGGCMVHNPRYDFNDANLPIGAAFWARLVERYLPVA
ncbi:MULTISPECIES: M20 aminoacylase family protein [Cupriavidus]|uniref:M20 aminoacylase family protein n=1 Tax=Cupriavidus TaxID=106589 RepID=UPI00036473DF|nr:MULTISPECIES: M20 aminoacylase family protein [Cupriavidus]